MSICELCPCDLDDHYDGVYCMVPECPCTADRDTLDAFYKGHECGAAVLGGLMGMAEAIGKRPQWTPCLYAYLDCGVCKGTGAHDGDPCPSCVMKKWYEDSRPDRRITMTDEHHDFLTRERVVYVLESKNPGTGPDFVVEDYYSAADLAEEQRAWIAPRYPRSEFRVVVYTPADT